MACRNHANTDFLGRLALSFLGQISLEWHWRAITVSHSYSSSFLTSDSASIFLRENFRQHREQSRCLLTSSKIVSVEFRTRGNTIVYHIIDTFIY